MKFKTTFILIVVLAMIAAYYFLVDQQKLKKAQEDKLASGKFLPYGADEIDSAEFHNPFGEVIKWERSIEGWLITSPVTTRGSSTTIDYILSQIVPGQKKNEFDPGGIFADYGLENPYAAIILFNRNQSRTDTIYFGDKTPVTHQCYVRHGSSPDITVTIDLTRDLVRKTLFQLRDKLFLNLDSDSITAISIHGDGINLIVENRSGTWLIANTRIGVDKSLIVPYLTSITEAIIHEFAAEDTLSQKDFGIGTPDRHIVIFTPVDSIRIDFGNDANKLVNVKRSGLNKIVMLESKYLRIFDWTQKDVMIMNLAFFIPGEVAEFHYDTPDTSVVLKLEGENWIVSKDPGLKINRRELQYLLMILRGLSFEQILKDTVSLHEYSSRMILKDASGDTLDVITVFGAAPGDHIVKSMSSGATGIIGKNTYDLLHRIFMRLGK